MSQKQAVAKVTLSSGKIVLLRELRITDTEVAAQKVASRSQGDGNVLQVLMQKALLQLVLVQIDGKPVSETDKEDMNSLFNLQEYTQLLKVLQKMSGGDEMGKEVKIETVVS
jgi:hypothetical protein